MPIELTYEKGNIEGVVGVGQIGNPTVGTEVLGNIKTTPHTSSLQQSPVTDKSEDNSGRLTAICTLDGTYV